MPPEYFPLVADARAAITVWSRDQDVAGGGNGGTCVIWEASEDGYRPTARCEVSGPDSIDWHPRP
jgi:hypothetical protein